MHVLPAVPACPYFLLCQRFLLSLHLPSEYFDWTSPASRCYCAACFSASGQGPVELRGGAPKRNYLRPLGTARVGLASDAPRARAVGAFDSFHIGYHGTRVRSLLGILSTGCLCKPGDVAFGGKAVGIRDGHYTGPHCRFNRAAKRMEEFDPNQVFLSPVLAYCFAGDVYSETVV